MGEQGKEKTKKKKKKKKKKTKQKQESGNPVQKPTKHKPSIGFLCCGWAEYKHHSTALIAIATINNQKGIF